MNCESEICMLENVQTVNSVYVISVRQKKKQFWPFFYLFIFIIIFFIFFASCCYSWLDD